MVFNRKNIQINNSTIHLMWFENFETSSYLDHLSEIEKERYFEIKHENRKQEFVATRILRHEIFGHQHIHYKNHGAPFIENEGYISISHTKNCVGIALNENHEIGFDLEYERPQIDKIQHKFISDTEKSIFNCDSKLESTKIWSAKEALYKLAGRKEIDFKTQLQLSKSKEEIWIGKIINSDHNLITELSIFESNELIISINSGPCEKSY
jgi:4'-phosphopantetheinyl transferase